jgi:hypothetical protein
MKFNKWTLGLAAIGAVSLTSAARADDVTNSLMTLVGSTTVSGYVDTSMNWTPGTGNVIQPGYSYSGGKADGFNLNSVDITIAKAEDETEWASGYDVDVFLGPDAATLGTGFGNSIKQAYVTLRTPIGTGIDWKLGIWDTIIGYEATEDPNNPNYTRSYGYTIEPTSHTGLNATYKISDAATVTLGIANTSMPATINGRSALAESSKTYMGALSFTAPTNFGFLSGSTAYVGFISGFDGGTGETAQNLYVGSTLNTPMSELKVGMSYDYFYSKQGYLAPNFGSALVDLKQSWANAIDLYSTYQATDKLSFNSRAEYFWQANLTGPIAAGAANKVFAITETVEYDLWKNVMSRVEFRWDHQAGTPEGGIVAGTYNGVYGGQSTVSGIPIGTKHNDYQFMANIIYKF